MSESKNGDTNTREATLLDCPFCGGYNIARITLCTDAQLRSYTNVPYCLTCGAAMLSNCGIAESTKRWNKRSSSNAVLTVE